MPHRLDRGGTRRRESRIETGASTGAAPGAAGEGAR